jgi:hypothetical protein
MIVPIDEIRILAERVKSAGRGAEIGFTREELELICRFPETFWAEVTGREDKPASGGLEAGSREVYM